MVFPATALRGHRSDTGSVFSGLPICLANVRHKILLQERVKSCYRAHLLLAKDRMALSGCATSYLITRSDLVLQDSRHCSGVTCLMSCSDTSIFELWPCPEFSTQNRRYARYSHDFHGACLIVGIRLQDPQMTAVSCMAQNVDPTLTKALCPNSVVF